MKQLAVEWGLRGKFTACFPMAAHAINNVDPRSPQLRSFHGSQDRTRPMDESSYWRRFSPSSIVGVESKDG